MVSPVPSIVTAAGAAANTMVQGPAPVTVVPGQGCLDGGRRRVERDRRARRPVDGERERTAGRIPGSDEERVVGDLRHAAGTTAGGAT